MRRESERGQQAGITERHDPHDARRRDAELTYRMEPPYSHARRTAVRLGNRRIAAKMVRFTINGCPLQRWIDGLVW
jgi:hypothetical protein